MLGVKFYIGLILVQGSVFKGVVHFKKKKKLLLIIYSPPCHPRYPCHSLFSRKEIKVFDENIPGFFSIKWFKVQKTVLVQTANCSKGFK